MWIIPQQAQSPTTTPTTSPKPFKSGDDYFDNGTQCERDGTQSHCFLDKEQRQRMVADLTFKTTLANTSYQSALSNSRVELLFKKEAGWGVAGDLIFAALSVSVVFGLEMLVTKVATDLAVRTAWAGEMAAHDIVPLVAQQKKVIVDSVKKGISASKSKLSKAFSGFPPDVSLKLAFTKVLQNEAASMFAHIRQEILQTCDDAGLLLAIESFDPARLTVTHYEEEIQQMIQRLEAQHLDEIGPLTMPIPHGTTEVVILQAWGKTRRAVVRFSEVRSYGNHGEQWQTDGKKSFLNWVDDDFVGAADALQREQFDGSRIIEVSGGWYPFDQSPEVDAWARTARSGAAK